MPEKVDYDRGQHAVYARGRAVPAETIARWMEAFARHAALRRPLSVLDLGSGTGRFSPALAETFGGPVYSVEPSERMRAVAQKSAQHPAVTYLAGSAERIPLPDNSCDLAVMYLVLHHVQRRAEAAQEIRRVLRPGGTLLIHSVFADRMPDLTWHRYFARARAIEEDVFPTLGEVVETFAEVGLRYVAVDQVRHRSAPSLADYAARLRLRAVSTFEYMTEEEITDGLAAMQTDAATEVEPHPVEDDCDLLVLRR